LHVIRLQNVLDMLYNQYLHNWTAVKGNNYHPYHQIQNIIKILKYEFHVKQIAKQVLIVTLQIKEITIVTYHLI